MLENKSILVTGGTGSFGKGFARTVLERYPNIKCLVIFSRDKLKQFEMSQEFSSSEYKGLRYFIGDVRDLDRVKRAMEGIDIVIHAAALKHAEGTGYKPFKTVKTSVRGAQKVIKSGQHTALKIVGALEIDSAAAQKGFAP